MRRSICLAALILTLGAPSGLLAADDSPFDRTSDLIYARKYGSALTMDVFRPRTGANGAASSSW